MASEKPRTGEISGLSPPPAACDSSTTTMNAFMSSAALIDSGRFGKGVASNAGQIPAERKRNVAGHHRRPVTQDLDLQRAAGQVDLHPARFRQAPRKCREHGHTRTAAAGHREAGAALVHFEAHVRVRQHLGNADVHLLGEQWVILDLRCKCFYVDGVHIVDEEHEMRIADVESDRVAQGAVLQVEMAGIALLAQWYVAPVHADAAHPRADSLMADPAALQDSRAGLEEHFVGLLFLEEQPCDATGGVAARFRFPPVHVPEAGEGERAASLASFTRLFDDDDLVCADARSSVAKAHR